MRKLFIANRGEIAVRIIRAAHALGIKTVQAVSEADGAMLAARLAGEVVSVGPARATKSYLNAEALVQAAVASGCDTVHPGYGFLSENADFASMVSAAGLAFVGPDPETIRCMGDKIAARRCAREAGVPVVPGSDGCVDAAEALAVAERIGFPVIVKASAGGGGRGIRVVRKSEDLAAQVQMAATEALTAFGGGGLYVERLIERARHIEVQVLGDGANVIHLHERDCSVQRRRQKVWEEAPAGKLSAETRDQLCDAAVRLAKFSSYRGAGTVEFLFDESDGSFFFIEMNTRIQVEHPVTEMITGVDIVREMIRIAGGQPLSISQSSIQPRGHAIECRINAEDPDRQFAPSPGVVSGLQLPGGPGVRFDGSVYEGYSVPMHYDSLLGKLIVWGDDRPSALARLRQALSEMSIGGLATTLPLHRMLAGDGNIAEQEFHTDWLEDRLAGEAKASDPAIGLPRPIPSWKS